jgi:putative toxin-antitoxin system antitoxin component (TIGR02293 family)
MFAAIWRKELAVPFPSRSAKPGAAVSASPDDAGMAADLLTMREIREAVHSGRIAVHDVLSEGLPSTAALGLMRRVRLLRDASTWVTVSAMSARSLQRLKADPSRRLSPETSGRLWRFAEVLARASDILGSQEAAETWLATPAIGLEQRRPIDLMATAAGAAMVEDLLDRMEYGVYA